MMVKLTGTDDRPISINRERSREIFCVAPGVNTTKIFITPSDVYYVKESIEVVIRLLNL